MENNKAIEICEASNKIFCNLINYNMGKIKIKYIEWKFNPLLFVWFGKEFFKFYFFFSAL